MNQEEVLIPGLCAIKQLKKTNENLVFRPNSTIIATEQYNLNDMATTTTFNPRSRKEIIAWWQRANNRKAAWEEFESKIAMFEVFKP